MRKYPFVLWKWLTIAFLLAVLVACSSPTAEPTSQATEAADVATAVPVATEAPTVIKVGAVHSLSGPIAIYGQPIRQGIELAIQQINDQHYLGPNTTIEMIFEDDAGDKEQAISAFEKLVNQDQVSAILGPTLSNSAFAADPVAQEAGIPVIGSSNTASGITDMGEFVFRTSLPESAVIPNTLKVVAEARDLQRVAIMYGNDDQFTTSGYQVFAAALEAQGIEVVGEPFTFAKGDTDFSSALIAIKNLTPQPQAVIVSALAEEAANIMLQAQQLQLENLYFIGGNGFNSPKLAQIAGEAAEGAISGAAWFIGSPVPANQVFVEAYRAKYNADPDQFAAQAYTAAWVLAEAIKNAGSGDPNAIREALTKTSNFATPLGDFSFDANRDPVHTPVVLIVKDGVFSLFEK